MRKKIVQENQVSIALVHNDTAFICDVQSALDFMMSVCYNDQCTCIAKLGSVT